MSNSKFITRHEIENAIISGEYGELDFYAYCITPWHAIGVRAYVNSMLKHRSSIRGVILISHNPGTEYLIDENVFLFESDIDVKIFKCKDSTRTNKAQYFFELIKTKKKIQQPLHNQRLLHILRPFRPDIKFGVEYQQRTHRKCELVCLDEGVGTYKSDYEIFKEKIRGNIVSGFIYMLGSFFYKYLSVKNRLIPEYFTLFKSKKGSLEINSNIAIGYKECIRQSSVLKIPPNSQKYVMLLTQPFEIEQDIACKAEINNIYDHLRLLLKDNGYDMVIKPHPRENRGVIDEYKRRGFRVLETKFPLEIYMESLTIKPEVVVGAVSTALVTANALNDIPAISVVYMVRDRLDSGYLKTAKIFNKRYREFIRFPKDDYDVISILNSVNRDN